jgi:hypothetical protein
MHAAAPNLKSFISITPQSDPNDANQVSSMYGHINVWATLPYMYQDNQADVQARIAAGDSVWLYNVLVQDDYSPKQNLNWGSLDWRLSLGYLSANANFTGWQQWAVDCWGNNPWVDGSPGGCSNTQVPGDGFSMYPGSYVGLVGYAPSIRIKWSRDGVNDFEYVHMLKNLGQGSWATSQIDPIAHDFTNWTRDYTQVESVRVALGNKIEQLSGGAPTPSASAPAITGASSAQGTVGTAFQYQITATNSPTSFAASGLPQGLSVNASTGLISGTPTTAGTSQVTVRASNSGGTGSATRTITIAASTGSASIALAQSSSVQGTGTQSLSAPFQRGNTSGNLIIAFVRMSSVSQTVQITDTAGNKYAEAVSQVQNADGHQVHVFYATNVKAGANTVRATFSAANNHPWLAIYEYSGLNKTSPLDRIAKAQGSGSTPSSGASSVTTNAHELIFAATGLPASYTGAATAGSGYTMAQRGTGTSPGDNETVVATSARSYTGAFTLSASANWTAVLATFKP